MNNLKLSRIAARSADILGLLSTFSGILGAVFLIMEFCELIKRQKV